ncbi:hypothetical protein CR513_33884, partial [Mucuna pruriens]
MENKTSRKGSTLILGRSFFMTAGTKIDVHPGTLSMEFDDNLVRFNIFDVMKHHIEDHSLFSIDIIDELVEEYMQLGTSSVEFSNFVEILDVMDCFNFVEDIFDSQHPVTLSMEFDDNLVRFNIFDVMKHHIEDHSLFSIDIIDELVEEYMQLGTSSVEFSNFVEIPDVMDCFNFVEDIFDSLMKDKFDSRHKKGVETESNKLDEAETDSNNLEEAETNPKGHPEVESNFGSLECKQIEAESDSGQPIPDSDRVDQPTPRSTIKFFPSPYLRPKSSQLDEVIPAKRVPLQANFDSVSTCQLRLHMPTPTSSLVVEPKSFNDHQCLGMVEKMKKLKYGAWVNNKSHDFVVILIFQLLFYCTLKQNINNIEKNSNNVPWRKTHMHTAPLLPPSMIMTYILVLLEVRMSMGTCMSLVD